MFRSVAETVCAEIVEKKSKFICHAFYVESAEEAEEQIKKMNKKYFDARHNCYAFRVMSENGAIDRFSDDGEPSGTAGSPILNILTAQNLCNILVVVTRYFGGILLGTGGLVKAYSEATIKALDMAKIVQKELGKEVKFVVSYADLEKLKYYLKQKKIKILNCSYKENVEVFAELTQEKFSEIKEKGKNFNFVILQYEVIGEKFIEV